MAKEKVKFAKDYHTGSCVVLAGEEKSLDSELVKKLVQQGFIETKNKKKGNEK